MAELILLQHQKTDLNNRDNFFIDETGSKIFGKICHNNFILCPESCIEYLRRYYIDELIYEQEIETLLLKREKKQILNSLFTKELEINKSYIKIEETKIKTIFFKIMNYIVDISYKNIALEFTPDSSIFFNILFNDIFQAHIEFYLTETNENYNNAFFNLFEKKESILSGYGKLVDIIKELNETI